MAGLITDKVLHSATKFLRIVFVLVAVALVVFLNLPHQSPERLRGHGPSPSASPALVFCMRAVFFAPMEEIQVPPGDHRLGHEPGLLHRLHAPAPS